ncbi:MAG: hypothetical protein WBD81_17800 [Collimonas pratensis]|uniref:hypothetical protein n=1 Tax=Collimonas pratensis TaxID=279113 RepID=UPI003C787D47
MDSFDKTNGIPVGDQEYRVEVKYSIKMTPTAENKKVVEEAVSALSNVDAELVKAEAGIKKYSADRAAYLQTHEGSSSFQYEVDSKSQYDEYQKSLASSETYREIKSNGPGRVKVVLQTNLLKECPAVNRNLMASFFTPEVSIARYSDNIVSDFTETIPMIKTDNGWQRRQQ